MPAWGKYLFRFKFLHLFAVWPIQPQAKHVMGETCWPNGWDALQALQKGPEICWPYGWLVLQLLQNGPLGEGFAVIHCGL